MFQTIEEVREYLSGDRIECLECCRTFKAIKHAHLQKHGMTLREYRIKWGIPLTYAVATMASSEKHRSHAIRANLGKNLIPGNNEFCPPGKAATIPAAKMAVLRALYNNGRAWNIRQKQTAKNKKHLTHPSNPIG